MDYAEFLKSKAIIDKPTGLETIPDLNPMLFDFQLDIVRWALKRGRAAIFADCGMGKTPMQLEWAKHIPGNVLIVAPLAVSAQTIREAEKFHDEEVKYSPDGSVPSRVSITNYERMEKFNPENYTGIVLDESSILKSYTGKYRTDLIERFGNVQYRLACTATPAPNDYMELGNHAEFLGIMTSSEMLADFFINDPAQVGHYRLKGHAESRFWNWMASWAVMIRRPSDLGYSDTNFILPELQVEDIRISNDRPLDDMLFPVEALTLSERIKSRRQTISERIELAANIAKSCDGQVLIWCDLNDESAMLHNAIPGSVEVKGSDSEPYKEKSLLGFSNNEYRVLVTKPKIAGFGMNWQNCHNVIFVGLSDSYEMYYQAIRRCWRYGQKSSVKCYIVTSETDGAVVKNIRRKEADAMRMAEEMTKNMAYISTGEIHKDIAFKKAYTLSKKMEVPVWLS